MRKTKEIKEDTVTINKKIQNEQLEAELKEAVSLDKQIKKRQARLNEIKQSLLKQLMDYNLSRFENNLGSVVYVPEKIRVSVPLTELRKNYPDVAEELQQSKLVKPYVRIKY